jgi:STAS-like domain of unknown function (DUF4325)
VVVSVLEHVDQCFSHEDGELLRVVLAEKLQNGEGVTLSFTRVTDVPSSFINAALVPFLLEHGPDWVKANLKIIGARKQILDMVRVCFSNAEQARLAA